ncbi:MAG TPA: LruC domain-containing protein, partial [Pirellulales bacterium]|nr:LruC domain-containing protein [Pirellulales bacterium]
MSGTLLFEDQWPHDGDLDFNDQVISYSVTTTVDSTGLASELVATYNVLAIGTSTPSGLYLHLPGVSSSSSVSKGLLNGATVGSLPNETDLVIPILDDTHSLFNSQSGYINTQSTLTALGQPIELDLRFTQPVSLGDAPFDLFIARTSDYTHQV